MWADPFWLHTDWSSLGIGAVLGHVDDEGNEYMCACISQSLNEHERNYCSYKGEMLAEVWAVRMFSMTHASCWLRTVSLWNLQRLMASRTLTGQYARWALVLQEFDFVIEHCPRGDAFDGTPYLPVQHGGAQLPPVRHGGSNCLALNPEQHVESAHVRLLVQHAVSMVLSVRSAADDARPQWEEELLTPLVHSPMAMHADRHVQGGVQGEALPVQRCCTSCSKSDPS
jgi:hypothetical protein